MSFKAPYYSKTELQSHAAKFLEKHNPTFEIPVQIEFIIESDFGMDIVPVPGLQSGFDIVAFITQDMKEIRVDEYVYLNRLNRYRFSLAHELAHRILHPGLWDKVHFSDIETWKATIEESIPEKEYGYIEFHANFFAGQVLVPTNELNDKYEECILRVREAGLDPTDEVSGAIDVIESHLGRYFEVSREVIHRRLQHDNLL